MIRTIYVFGYFGIYMLFTGFLALRYKMLGWMKKEEAQKAFLLKASTKWARRTVKSTGSTVEVVGLENLPEGNVLYVGNHQGYLDIPLLMAYLPGIKGFVAKIELLKVPVLRYWMKNIGCIFMDRSSLRQSMQVMMDGIERLKKGETMVIFPEGTRTRTGEVDEFKKGSLQLAVKSGVPVVPITIDGSYNVFEESGRVKKADITITVHPAIHMEALSPEDKKNLAEIVREKVISAL